MTHSASPSPIDQSSDFIGSETARAASEFDMLTPLDATGGTSLPFICRIKGREFFMKRLKPELSDNEAYRNLFRKEFHLGRELRSPHIVKYEQLVESETDIYILRENVCGATLDQKLRISPEWFGERKHLDRLFNQLLDAVEHMHSCHVVHADLKPQNVMLTRINNDVKIIDLGFAFADSYTYSTGCTPGYAAPEQQEANKQTVDASTDVYAIGKLMEFIERESGQRLPGVYQIIMKRCLQKEQHRRYQHVSEIKQLINRRRHLMRKTIISLSVCLAVGMAALFFFNTSTGFKVWKSVKWNLRQVPYDFRMRNVLYRYASPDSTLAVVVGSKTSYNGDGEDDGDNIKIYAHLTLPNGKICRVTQIEDSAFYDGYNFTSVRIPHGIKHIGKDSFCYCSRITCINLPASVSSIGEQAFARMENLQVLHLPDSLQSLPIGMAHHCPSLTGIKLPDGIRTLPMDLLACCTRLQEVVMPDSLERIERGVFWECSQLPEITLPATVKYIGEFSFFHCDKLRHVYLHAPTPPEMTNAFQAKGGIVTIHVPRASVNLYRQHLYWKRQNIVGDL